MKIKNDNDIIISDILKAIQSSKKVKGLGFSDSLRVIHAYLAIVIQTMLVGYSFEIPGLGVFDIHKQKENEATENINRSRRELAPVYHGSFRKIGYRYWVVFESKYVDLKLMKFIPAKKIIGKYLSLVHGSDYDFKEVTPCQ